MKVGDVVTFKYKNGTHVGQERTVKVDEVDLNNFSGHDSLSNSYRRFKISDTTGLKLANQYKVTVDVEVSVFSRCDEGYILVSQAREYGMDTKEAVKHLDTISKICAGV